MQPITASSARSIDLIRVLTCGSVDDGKSTLIGRLMLDAGVVKQDVLRSLTEASKVSGTVRGGVDPALLLDGLKAEREQGITIDVAHHFFATKRRSFIIADCPGHEQYTRNMITGASVCDAAVVLINAEKGIIEQTRRHSFLIALLGIKHVVVAVNKMDSVSFDEEVFSKIRSEYSSITSRLGIKDLSFVPVSALGGDNVVGRSENMPWYTGATLLHKLENLHISSDTNLVDMRLPIQFVHRSSSDYRGYSGTMAAGILKINDEVIALPSRMRAKVEAIDFPEQSTSAFANQAVTVRLDKDIDLSRGDMLTSPGNMTHISSRFEAMVVWMNAEPLIAGSEYVIKHTCRRSRAVIEDIRYEVDIETFHRKKDVEQLRLNSIGRCAVRCSEPMTFDSYERNRTTGSFILIDRRTNDTVAAGMIIDRLSDESSVTDSVCSYPIFWLTGNSGAGKSTLAFGVRDHLKSVGDRLAEKIVVLDGDEMRATVSTHEDLSPEGRRSHNLRVARLAKLLQSQGFLVIVSVIAPFEDVREELSHECSPLWIHVKKEGLTSDDKPYESPKNPDFVADHDCLGERKSIEKFAEYVRGSVS